MFARHRLGPANKLDCPDAMGTDAFSPQRPESFRYFLLLSSPPLFITDASRQIFESALERVRRSFSLQAYGYVVIPEHVHLLLSEPERDTNCPTQAKIGLEWATCPQRDTLADTLKLRRLAGV